MSENNPKYRLYVIKALPQLDNLDSVDISHEERVKVEHLSLEDLFQAQSDYRGVSPSNPPTVSNRL